MLLREGAHDGEALIPPTVQAMVAARLDSLPPEQRDLARRLAVYMYDFDLEEVRIVADVGEIELDELVDAEIIVREEGTVAPVWRFRQDVLRDVAYASLPKRERQRLHSLIAQRLRARARSRGRPTTSRRRRTLRSTSRLAIAPRRTRRSTH